MNNESLGWLPEDINNLNGQDEKRNHLPTKGLIKINDTVVNIKASDKNQINLILNNGNMITIDNNNSNSIEESFEDRYTNENLKTKLSIL